MRSTTAAMNKLEKKGWARCPVGKTNIFRKIVGEDERGLPIIVEIQLENKEVKEEKESWQI